MQTISRSSKEAFSRVQRAKILLAYSTNEATNSIAKRENRTRPTVEQCVDKALTGGMEVTLSDLKRKCAPSKITAEAKLWVINIACTKPTEHG